MTDHTLKIRFSTRLILWCAILLVAGGFARAQDQEVTELSPNGITGVVVSPDGTQLAVAGTNGLLKIIDAATGLDVRLFTELSGTTMSVSWSSDGLYLASAHYQDAVVRIWDANSGQLLHSMPILNTTDVAWSHSGDYLAAVDYDDFNMVSHVLTYRWPNLELVCSSFFNGGIMDVNWHPSVAVLAVANYDTNRIDIEASCNHSMIEVSRGYVYSVAFDPSGERIALGIGEAGEIAIYHDESFEEQSRLHVHSAPVGALAWSPDGQYIASAAAAIGEMIRVTEVSTGRPVTRYPVAQAGIVGIGDLAFSADGTRLYYGDGTEVMDVPAIAPETLEDSVTTYATPHR